MAPPDRTDTVDRIESTDESLLVEHDWTDERELGTAITNAVADLTGTPPERVGTDLRRSVDFDGLERIFTPMADGTLRESAQVVIGIESCVVTVHTDGWVSVVRTAADRE